MDAILVLTTVDSEDLGRRIAAALVEANEAACVSMVPAIRSIYRWEGKVREDGELLLLIKTVAERFGAVRSRILQIHSYQVPEVIAVPITGGDSAYMNWLASQVGPMPQA
jgi:periplasmic divalent cation tolerance protein